MKSFALFLFTFFALALSKQYSLDFTWTGGDPSCKNCGEAGQYACSAFGIGEWNNGTKTFRDPSENGHVLTSVSVSLFGSYSCGSTPIGSNIRVYLDGTLVGQQQVKSTKQCTCNSCDGVIHFKNNLFVGGWPEYKVWGMNVFQVLVGNGDPICLHRAQLNLTFAAENRNALTKNLRLPFVGGEKGCSQCSLKGEYKCLTKWVNETLTFQDPVPSKAIVKGVDMYVYGTLYNPASNYYTVTLQGQRVERLYVTPKNVVKEFQCDYCNSRILFESTSYQMGWPGYNYGGLNKLAISTDYSYLYCVSQVELVIRYFPLR